MISYAQNFEDVMLWRALKDVQNGAYIDLGACDPVADSVSLHFYKNGWRGVHVEPVPFYAEALRRARPDEMVLERAVGHDGEEITIHAFEGTGLSTSSQAFADRHKKAGFKARPVKVCCVSLASVFDAFNRQTVHWLKIDVEGMEASVLRSWGTHHARPWIVLVESTLPNSQEVNHEEWESCLLQRDYRFVYFDGLNRYYIHAEQAARASAFDVPPNVFDKFTVSAHTPLGSELASQIQETRVQVGALAGQVEVLKSEVEIREKELGRLRAELGTRASAAAHEIEIREAELQRLRGEIAGLAARAALISDRDAEILRLHIAIEERTKSFNSTLTAQAKAFEGAIETTVAEYERRMLANSEEAARRASEMEAAFAANLSFWTTKSAESDALSAKREAALDSVVARARSLQSDLGNLEHRLAAVASDAAHWRAEMEARQAHIDAIRSSTSWKISAPVRWGMQGLRSSAATFRSAVRPVLEGGLQLVRANPWLKPPILVAVRLVPSLERKITSFAVVRPVHGQDGLVSRDSDWNLTVDPKNLSGWSSVLNKHTLSDGSAR